MNENLKSLYDKIYKDESTKDPKKFIRIFEQDLSVIELPDLNNYDDYKMSTRLLSDYAQMLVAEGYVRKAVPFLNKAIKQVESDKDFSDTNKWSSPVYESLVWNRAFTNFSLKNIKEAKVDLKNLTDHFPENDRYRNWLKACDDRKFVLLEWSLFSLVIISSISYFAFGLENDTIRYIALLGILIGFFGGLFTGKIRKKRLQI